MHAVQIAENCASINRVSIRKRIQCSVRACSAVLCFERMGRGGTPDSNGGRRGGVAGECPILCALLGLCRMKPQQNVMSD